MKFNTKTQGNETTNYAGAKAYKMNVAMELYATVVTSALSDNFYEKTGDRLTRLRELIAKNDPVFVAKLAVYAREKMYLRSIPLVLAVELAKIHNGDNLISRMVARVIQRADEITELLAYYQLANQRTQGIKKLNALSKQMQKGLVEAFNKFDSYQFAKYNRDGEVKLKDALFLVHPKAKDEAQQAIFNQIVNDSLSVPYTWETELSALGQMGFDDEKAKKAAFRAKWEELIESGKLGYMALLRNLRNMLQAEVSREHIKKVADRLANPKEVAKSKQFPFRFLAAYRELKGGQIPRRGINLKEIVFSSDTTLILNALEKAIVASVVNLQGFDENTKVLVACDTSGSMQQNISSKSSIQLFDVGLVLGMLLQNRSQSVISGIFGDTWKVINLPSGNILANADELHRREGEVGYSTNGYLVIKDLIKRKKAVDKVMIFTDCQLWDSNFTNESIAKYWDEYKKIAPNAKIYLFDLAGYGQAPLNIVRNDVFLIAGWSERVFEVLEAIENGNSALSEIEKVVI
ncbi:MAG: TROVE domain-containing protein [Microscillaceae bacterium]|nr:TROVE domain-containing protein [Microscillaceae bacterium]